MKNIKQIREEKELLEERDDSEDRKIATLVRAGLLDAKKLPLLKRAMDKDNTKITPVERRVLLDLLDNLLNQVTHNKGVFMKVRQSLSTKEESLQEDKESRIIPNILVLQRKSVRQFQDGLVGLYYARKLDKYVSIPFFEPSKAIVAEDNTTNIEKLQTINEECELMFEDGNKYSINSTVANKIVNVYEAMNKKNKKKMEKMLNESVESFNKVMNFAVRQ
jgi:hypothetical protein